MTHPVLAEVSRVESQIVPINPVALRLEDAPNPSTAVAEYFTDAMLCTQHGVAQALKAKVLLDGMIAELKARRDEWANEAKRAELALETLKTRAKAAIEANPNVAFKCQLGELKLQKSNAAVKTSIDTNNADLLENLSSWCAGWFGVPPEYVKISVSLDKKKIADDLKSGASLDWASLEQSFSVRFK